MHDAVPYSQLPDAAAQLGEYMQVSVAQIENHSLVVDSLVPMGAGQERRQTGAA